MAKGYWVAHVDVLDPQAYRAYQAANAVAFSKYGGRFLVRGGEQQPREGAARRRCVVIEFDSPEQARACYDSPEYQAAKALRLAIATADLVIVDGWDG